MLRYAKAVVTGSLFRWNDSYGVVRSDIFGRAARIGPEAVMACRPYHFAAIHVIESLFNPVFGVFSELAPRDRINYKGLFGVLIAAYTHSLNWCLPEDQRSTLVIELGVDGLSAGIESFWNLTPPSARSCDADIDEYARKVRSAALEGVLYFAEIQWPCARLLWTFEMAFTDGASLANNLRVQQNSAAA